ncbi:hypothetical protein LOM8899_02948 [Flavimaricola marinus]|uniref:Uncharacterized protein n=1 Tax=Flavimaricola marinus TaxID=1819565 RepID=A0A238LGU6_9RHOB|nr:hypothetical protein LOM8899_02948 [Flavimaricola marinus]
MWRVLDIYGAMSRKLIETGEMPPEMPGFLVKSRWITPTGALS